jgi:O-succinylbenzoic acid--CoA ligase
VNHWLEQAALRHPERDAIAGVTYGRLLELARAAAGALIERGVSPGDRVAIALPTGADFAAVLHGCFLCGAVAVPIDLRLGAAERAARSDGAAVVVDEPLAGRAGRFVREPLSLESVATLMHTSGTTSSPRPVALTFANWLANALGSAVALGLDVAERWLCPLPLVHVGGLSILIRSAVYGTTVVLQDRFDAAAACSALMDPDERITLISVVPTMLARLLDAGLQEPPTLRWALLGGGPIPRPLMWRAVDAGIPVAPTYGMTEACSQIATHRWPLPGVELRIASDGELLVQGPMVAQGSLAADGWLHTGDLGALDGRGRLTITGRKADTIITGGENVAPAEVEAVLLEHPAVADAAVFGRADAEWGEAVIARVVLREGASVEAPELREFCVGRLAAFKIPKTVEIAPRLPRTDFGKLLRRELA